MKKALLILCCGVMFSFSSEAQKKKTTTKVNVPEAVSSSFQGKFADTESIKWSKNYAGNYVATFTNANKEKLTAEYDANGAFVRSKTVISTEAVPEVLANSVAAQYTDAKVTEIAKLELSGIPAYYKVKLDMAGTNKEILVSEEGTITE